VDDAENKRKIELLCNNLKFGATTIAAMRWQRWQAELCFKQVKQNLKIKYLLRGDKRERSQDAGLLRLARHRADAVCLHVQFSIVETPLASEHNGLRPHKAATVGFAL
jgi:hypothetical protein